MQVVAPRTVSREPAFARSGVVTASWFPVARTRDVRAGRVRGVDLLGRRLALWRSPDGAVRALDARCPHLGADLSGGAVRDGALVCPLHGWAFGPDGACVRVPGGGLSDRRARPVPVQERWGLVWAFNAPEPLFELPEPPPGRWRIVRPPPRAVGAHAHLVIGNGLDVTHFEALHGLEPLAEPVLTVAPPFEVSVALVGRPRSRALRRLVGTGDGGAVRFSFTTTGGHLARVDVEVPVRFRALFTATPTPGGCRTQVVLFLPRSGPRLLRAAVGLYALLHDDVAVLEGLRFRRAFTEADAPLAAFADAVDAMPRGWGAG